MIVETFKVKVYLTVSRHFPAHVLGRQANLKESSESKELAELRLQVLVVVTSDACESKKEIMRLKSGLQSKGRGACY